jgi:hypothetical protein
MKMAIVAGMELGVGTHLPQYEDQTAPAEALGVVMVAHPGLVLAILAQAPMEHRLTWDRERFLPGRTRYPTVEVAGIPEDRGVGVPMASLEEEARVLRVKSLRG